ncbi:MAG: hypothetical protein J3Q66DRAFT_330442 [Benniella sp.]|nr:MAG: hypothetical protein J3Q66DRAFT_330442 [Benniella sp.]
MDASPFHIQELIEEIGRYLDLPDLAHCARVCKSWYTSFAPLVHHNVRHDPLSGRNTVTLWTGIQRYSLHIRSLTVTGGHLPRLELLGGPDICCRLTTLSLGPLGYVGQPLEWCSSFKDLIDHNPGIQTLQIHLHERLESVIFDEYRVLRRLPELKNLAIMSDVYPDDSFGVKANGVFEAILECGPRLESLTYHVLCSSVGRRGTGTATETGVETATVPSEENNPQPLWMNLTSLTIYDELECRAIELLKHCHNLKQLKVQFLYGLNRHRVLEYMAHQYVLGVLSSLEHLEITGVQGSQGPMALTLLLRACAIPYSPLPVSPSSSSLLSHSSLSSYEGLKSFGLVHSDLSAGVIWALMTFHAKSLEKVIVLDTVQPGSFEPSHFLTHCPRLRHLETSVWGGQTWIQDLIGQSPWVCHHRLEILRLTICQVDMRRFGGGSPSKDWQRQFWRQIGELTNLEILDLAMAQAHPPFPRIISVMREDLEPICGLKRLREMRILQWQQVMTPAVLEELQTRRPWLRILICGALENVESPDQWC